jgi:integrase
LQAVLLRYWHHHGRTRASKDPIKQALAWVTDELPLMTVASFDRPRQVQFLDALKAEGLAASTIARYMGVIRSALVWSHRNGEIPRTDPLAMPEAEEEHGVTPFSLAEMRAVLEACTSEMERRMVLLWTATACRPHQVLDLTWDRVSRFAVDFRLPGARIVKKRRAIVPLAPSIADYLDERRGLGHVLLSEKHTRAPRPIVEWKKKFQRVLKRADVPGSGYRVRKFAATYLVNHGVPYAHVAIILGHRPPEGGKETWRYALHSPTYMPEARQGIERMVRELRPSWLRLASDWQGASANPLNLNAANDG